MSGTLDCATHGRIMVRLCSQRWLWFFFFSLRNTFIYAVMLQRLRYSASNVVPFHY